MTDGFLPICKQDMEERGISRLDFVYVIGDAYVDHPSFGHAVISRVLEKAGYSVGILSQPDWKDPESITALGRPRLAFLVSAGNMDSMVNHYYVSKKRRPSDAYTPGGKPFRRPDHAAVVYGNLIRRAYRDVPVILGGIEASLRRLAHYDYWSDSLKRSVLLDSQADLISYGMGERSIVEIADALRRGIPVRELTDIRGTVYRTREEPCLPGLIRLPGYADMQRCRRQYAESFRIQYENTDACTAKPLAEPYPDGTWVVQNPPQRPLSTPEMDAVYDLPYQRTFHPSYEALGGVPALSEVQFSLISSRGCFGGCSFCALTFHQGRTVQARSHASILREARLLTRQSGFKGYLHDVGGPTANFRHPSCQAQLIRGVCKNRQCLFPQPCPSLQVDHSDYLALLRSLRSLPGVKKVFIRSGIRFDYLLADPDDTFFRELVRYHVSGQLKVAPEHISDTVLQAMGKPGRAVYERFLHKYRQLNEAFGLKQYVVPYLMSSHPGSTLQEAIELAQYLKEQGVMPQQVQDFYPTPSTLSTVMYATGLDPRTMRPVFVCRNPHEKAMQRALIRYRDPAVYDLVKEALCAAGRQDLIGFGKDCLIRPRRGRQDADSRTGKGGGREAPGRRTAASGKPPGAKSGKSREQPGVKPANGRPPGAKPGKSGEQPGARTANGKPPGAKPGKSGEQPGTKPGARTTSERPPSAKKKTIRNIHPKKQTRHQSGARKEGM